MTLSREALVEITSADIARFWTMVDRRGPDECWPWLGAKAGKDGRGRMTFGSSSTTAPRVALMAAGIYPADISLFACHKCDNPNCVNPAHLWWGTNSENLLDASAKKRLANNKKTHCPQGHPLSGRNLYIVKGSQRRCLKCTYAANYKRRRIRFLAGLVTKTGRRIREAQHG